MANQTDIAAHLGVSQSLVSQLLASGVLPPGKRGAHDTEACRVAYLNHLREVAAGRGSADGGARGLDLVAERARLAREQADRIAMENELRRGQLVEISGVAAEVGASLSRVRTRLLAIPSETAQALARSQLPAVCCAIIQAAIDTALTELSTLKDFENGRESHTPTGHGHGTQGAPNGPADPKRSARKTRLSGGSRER